MLNLHIPQLGEDSKNAKDLVVSILAREQPLSLIQLVNIIQRQHNLGLTYQAVRKGVSGLLADGVLQKTGKTYAIRKEWALSVKSFVDKLLGSYASTTRVHAISKELLKENYAVYTFSNLLDLDTFWGDVMKHWADTLQPEDARQVFCYGHYTWWMLINLGRETELFEYFRRKKIAAHFMALTDNPLNRWACSLYQAAGTTTSFNLKTSFDDTVGVNVLGDTIIQVQYPREIVRKIKALFESSESITALSPSAVATLAHTTCETKFMLFKNKAFADSVRKAYLTTSST